jgi:hypothetical protein
MRHNGGKPEAGRKGTRERLVSVGCYSGSRHAERPQWVHDGGGRRAVARVQEQWREQDRLGWRVELEDGSRLVLYYQPHIDAWSAREEQ